MLKRLITITSRNRQLIAAAVCLTLTFNPDLEASSGLSAHSKIAASVTSAPWDTPAQCDQNPKYAEPLQLCFEHEQWLATGTDRVATFAPAALFLPPVPTEAINY